MRIKHGGQTMSCIEKVAYSSARPSILTPPFLQEAPGSAGGGQTRHPSLLHTCLDPKRLPAPPCFVPFLNPTFPSSSFLQSLAQVLLLFPSSSLHVEICAHNMPEHLNALHMKKINIKIHVELFSFVHGERT